MNNVLAFDSQKNKSWIDQSVLKIYESSEVE